MALKVAQRTLQKMLAFHLRFVCNTSAFCLQFICVLLAIHPRKACNFSYRLYLLGTKNAAVKKLLRHFGDSAAIRTQDPRLRRALLYPAELRNQP